MNIETVPKEYVKKLSYDDALLYCQLIEIDGKSDWRMPTVNECKHINPILLKHSRYTVEVYRQYWVDTGGGDLHWVFDTLHNRILNPYSRTENWICPIRYDIITT
jgi:hypothetical protein